MKTETPAPAANLSVAQLGQALAKSKSPPPDPKQPSAKPAALATSREPLPAKEKEGDEGADEPTDLSQTAPPGGDAGGDTSNDDAGKGEGDEGGEGEGQTPPAGDEPAQPETPATISAAAAQRLNKELDPLIQELTKAGAKGALQILQKRIPKLVDQRDTERQGRLTAEQRASELETQLAEAQQAPSEPRRSSAGHPAVAQINDQLAQVDGFIARFKANPNGLTMQDGDATVELTADEVSEHLDKLKDRRTELLAERKITEQNVKSAHAQAYQQIHAQAIVTYPWLAQKDAPEQGRMKQILKAIPGLQDLPDHELIVARYFRGMAAEQAAAAAPKKPATQKAPPSREPTQVNTDTPGSKAGPATDKSKAQQAVKDAQEQFKKTGKMADMQKVESAKRALARIK
jgi:hypothetical protein